MDAIRGVRDVSNTTLWERLRDYRVDLSAHDYFVATCLLEDYEQMQKREGADDLQLLIYGICNIANELFKDKFSETFVFKSQNNEICILVDTAISSQTKAETKRIEHDSNQCATRLIENLKRYLRVTVSVGISRCFSGETHLPEAYVMGPAYMEPYMLELGQLPPIVLTDVDTENLQKPLLEAQIAMNSVDSMVDVYDGIMPQSVAGAWTTSIQKWLSGDTDIAAGLDAIDLAVEKQLQATGQN